MRRYAALLLVIPGAVFINACSPQEPQAPVRPVRTTTVSYGAAGEAVTLTGQVQPRDQINLAFRVDGRMIERRVSIGDRVAPRQLVARLEAQDAANTLQSAEADLAEARATFVQAQSNERRFGNLVRDGVVSAAQYEDAQRQLASAESRVKAAEARVRAARDGLSYTELRADAAGVVTAEGAETGEVVRAGQMIVQVAQQGGKDAVFNVPATLGRAAPKDPVITVALSSDPGITTRGRVREVSPQADPVTGTYAVKVGLENPPQQMGLGATVTGTAVLGLAPVASVPATALTRQGDKPAVWVVDPQSKTVSLRPVVVLRYEGAAVVIDKGLKDGDIVVTAGVQALHPGQKVRLLDHRS